MHEATRLCDSQTSSSSAHSASISRRQRAGSSPNCRLIRSIIGGLKGPAGSRALSQVKWCRAKSWKSLWLHIFQNKESELNGVLLAISFPFVVPRANKIAAYKSSSFCVKFVSSHHIL